MQVGNQHFSGLYRATVSRGAHPVLAFVVAPFVRACVEADPAPQAPNRPASIPSFSFPTDFPTWSTTPGS